MDYALLARQVNTLFQVCSSSGRMVELTLFKAILAPPTPIIPGKCLPGDAGFEKFSLIFRGPKDELIESAIQQFEHGQLGRFDMYIGQIGVPDSESVRYETVFNRPAPASAHAQRNNLKKSSKSKKGQIMATPYLGEIRMFAGNFAIKGWACATASFCPLIKTRPCFPF